MATKRSMNSGLAESISENSSTTMNSDGIGVERLAVGAGLLVVAHRRVVAGVAQQLLATRHLAGQGVLHAVDEGELVGRLVMTAETCGMSAMPAKVAPPLKSTSTRLSCSEECVITRPSTRVRRNSDLPEPVAPMTRPCGPMPCWADSLMSRWIRPPESPMPDRHPQPVAGRSRTPGGGGVVGEDVAEAEQVHVVGRAEVMSTAAAGVGRLRAGGLQRRDPAGERLRGGDVALVGQGLDSAPRAGAAPASGPCRRTPPRGPRRDKVGPGLVDLVLTRR